MLPLMYIFEISDIMFLIKSLKSPSISFNINHYISFSTSGTRSSGTKLIHNISFTNKHRNHFCQNLQAMECLTKSSLGTLVPNSRDRHEKQMATGFYAPQNTP